MHLGSFRNDFMQFFSQANLSLGGYKNLHIVSVTHPILQKVGDFNKVKTLNGQNTQYFRNHQIGGYWQPQTDLNTGLVKKNTTHRLTTRCYSPFRLWIFAILNFWSNSNNSYWKLWKFENLEIPAITFHQILGAERTRVGEHCSFRCHLKLVNRFSDKCNFV